MGKLRVYTKDCMHTAINDMEIYIISNSEN